ncbi:MAG: hypothetical protein J6V66_01525 [Clostridia bacterium]|nr:hypothetical protein [Clostridia bacterium]
MSISKCRILNGNALKIIAAVFMVIDHVGFVFYPNIMVYRYLGRLAMPVFAFMIAEGCRYTKNRPLYFTLIFLLGTICQVVYAIFDPNAKIVNILITFSLAILTVYSLDFVKKAFLERGFSLKIKALSIAVFIITVSAVYTLCYFYEIDYGFVGCMLPAFASLFDFRRIDNEKAKKLDLLFLRVLAFSVGLVLFVFTSIVPVSFTVYSLFGIILLLLYNGKRGKLKMKYFFYVFYPLHLGVIEGVYLLLK